jgi:hypothetical protein
MTRGVCVLIFGCLASCALPCGCSPQKDLPVTKPAAPSSAPAATTNPASRPGSAKYTPAEFHRMMAAQLFNQTWELLDKPVRTPDEDDLMIFRANASAYHWTRAGGPKELCVAHWQIARVYSVLKRAEPALYHARRSLGVAEAAKLDPFHTACAHQGLAQALALNKDFASARAHVAQARELLKQVPDPEDRKVVESDLANIPLQP